MNTIEEILPGLWTFPIILPDNPLKWLNCYVIKGGPESRDLLIDTGFKRPECAEALAKGMKALGLQPENTDVFLSHVHSDHTGNAAMLQSMGCRLLMSKVDYEIYTTESERKWKDTKNRALLEGMDEAMLNLVFDHNPAVLYRSEPFTPSEIREGDTLTYGEYTLRCIFTPGHTPGHMCLYEPEKKIMFLGDHVLFDITPNICTWPVMEDALGTYLESLEKLSAYEVDLALPAHRNTGDITMYQRIDHLLDHHAARLAETEHIVREQGPIDAYQLSGKMTWRIRARSWEEFPPGQKWFAFGETLAHLDYLVKRGRIRKNTDSNGNVTYYCD